MWKILVSVVGVAITVGLRRILASEWERRRGGAPPSNTADDDTTWKDALVFAVITGAAVGVARIATDRLTAEAWRRARGDYPPGIKHGRGDVLDAAKRQVGVARAHVSGRA